MGSSVVVVIYFFAKSRELLGQNKATLDVPTETTSAALVEIIHNQFPRLTELRGCFALSLNEDYISVSDNTSIHLQSGTTRDVKNGRRIINLQYECYKGMAGKEIAKICQELRHKWSDVTHIVVWHRLGSVPVMESSVVIAISSPHRADALAATQACIDQLKARVPIWKKEIYNDGSSEWMENKECSWNERNSRSRDAS